MTGSPTRRSFLLGAGAVAGSVVTGFTRPWRAVVALVPRPLDQRIAGLLRDRAAATAIGRAADAAAPVDALVRSIATRLAGSVEAASALDDADLRAALADAVYDDFVAGDTVRVGGWVLSTTEVDVCALVALATG